VAARFGDTPGEDLDDGGCGVVVDDQNSLVQASGSFGGDGVGDVVSAVAVGDFADVVAGFDVLFGAAAGLFEEVADVPVGDGAVHAAYEHGGGGGVAGGDVDGFVGAPELYVVLFEPVFEFHGGTGVAGGARDLFGDNDIEGGLWGCCGGEEVGDATVTRDGDVELLVRGAVPALVEIHAAGFDVPVVGDDHNLDR
jgi:hypothetical protein